MKPIELTVTAGVNKIASDHRLILEEIDAIDNDPWLDPVKTLRALQRHVLCHFSDEEDIMVKVLYPALARHRELHENLADQLATISAELIENGRDLEWLRAANREFATMVRDHIASADSELEAFMRYGQHAVVDA